LTHERQEQIVGTVHNFLVEVVDAHLTEAQLKTKKWNLNPETYLQVLTKKAADIDGRMKVGAIYAGGTREEIEALSRLGRNLGILLIIRAEFVDIFDFYELGNRVKNECLPLPILYAITNKTTRSKIKAILSREKIRESECEEILSLLEKAKSVGQLKSYLRDLVKESNTYLERLDDNQARNTLKELFSSLLEDL
jgi:geranylgeranyl diphosphate synthase type I